MSRRLCDIAVASLVLVLASPLMAIAAIAILLESRGGVFYRQRRAGKDGHEFDVLKLRTMIDGAEHQGAGLAVDAGDARITKVGAVLRRTSIDELPNFVNVLRGEMAVIGPRPTVPEQVQRYSERQFGRLAIRPGITGWAQVNGRTSLPWDERIELDLWYIEHRSLRLDLQILSRTALLVVGGDGLYRGSTGGWNPGQGKHDADTRAQAAQTFRRRRLVAGGALLVVLVAGALLVRGVASGGEDDSPPAAVFRFSAVQPPQWLVQDTAVANAQRRLDFLSRGGDNRKEIALTFDDGPTKYTRQILKTLKKHGAHATFFQVGKQVREHPEITAQMASTPGVEIGNHTDAHALLSQLGLGDQEHQITGGAQAIIDAGGRVPRLFRPPYGATNDTTMKLLDQLGALPVLWSIDSLDYTRPGVDAIVDGIVDRAEPGSIVLMHDGVENRAQTVAALPKIISRLKKRGYRFVTVSEMLVNNPPPESSDDTAPKPYGID